jgi:hypothetical protein
MAMKPRPEEELDEARIQALFERTAELPSGALLTKLAARAADVPLRHRRAWAWLSLRLALPASAIVVGALAVVLVPRLGQAPPAPVAAPMAMAAGSSQGTDAPPAPAPELDALESEELYAELYLAEESGSELSLDLMHGPASEADVDAWLVATAMLLDEGG